MKKFRSTIVFAIIVGAIATYAVLEYRKIAQEDAGANSPDRVVKGLNKEDITAVKITRQQDTLEIVKEGDDWVLKSPVNDLADTFKFESFVGDIVDEDAKKLELDSETVNWASYGLDKPKATIEITAKSGTSYKLQVGSKEAFDGSLFVRRGDEQAVFMGDVSWKSISEKSAKDLRSKVLYREKGDVTQVYIYRDSMKTPAMEFAKLEDKWQLVGQPSIKVDQNEVNTFVRTLTDLEAQDFVSEEKSNSELKKYELHKPVLKVQMTVTGQVEGDSRATRPWTIEFSKEKDNKHHVVTSGAQSIFSIAKGKWGSVDKKLKDFRDKSYPFKFDKEKVNEIRFAGNQSEFHLKKTNGTWDFVKAQKGKKILSEKVATFVRAVNNLTVNHYFEGDKNKKISEKKNFVDILDDKGQEIFTLVWSAEKVGGKKFEGENLFLAKTNLSDEVLGVNMFRFTDLPLGFIEDEKKDSKTEKKP